MSDYLVGGTGDLHTGSTVGLCVPRFQRDDGDWWTASPGQRWLWENWLRFTDHLGEQKVKHGVPLIGFINGEAVDKNWHKTSQLVSVNTSDILRLGKRVLRPFVDVCDHLILTRGTEAHSGINGELDEIIAEQMGATPDPLGRYARWTWNDEVAGVLWDVAHHPGAGGTRESATGRAALTLGMETILRYERLGLPRPHLIIRGHNHVPGDSGDNFFTADRKTRAYILPGWQLPTSFTYRINGSELPVGGLVVKCSNGDWEAESWREYLVKGGKREGVMKWS